MRTQWIILLFWAFSASQAAASEPDLSARGQRVVDLLADRGLKLSAGERQQIADMQTAALAILENRQSSEP